MLTFTPITLEANHGDEEAVLILRAERLVAIASRLGEHHGGAAGEWFVETVFNDGLRIAGRRCATLEDMTSLIELG